jgi:hypothetical protein
MPTKRLLQYARIWMLLAGAAASAHPVYAQLSSSILPATTAADVAPTAVSVSISSQSFQATPVMRLPDAPSDGKDAGRIGVERLPSRRNWILLSVVQHGAAAFDAYSTRRAIATGATEDDPFMRPFANSPAIYAATQVSPFVLDYAARKMQRSRNGFIRTMWWLPQSTGTAASIFSGVHNLHVAGQP